MSFYIEAQLIKNLNSNSSENKKRNFEVTFSNYTEDDKKIEQIISKGLNSFQKRNSTVRIDDGFIEFFENNSVKLNLECSFIHVINDRELEHLRQELITVFQPSENSQAAVPAVIPTNQPALTPNLALEVEEMKQDLEAAFVSTVNSNIKSFQHELRKELNAQLDGFRTEITNEMTRMLVDIKNETEKSSAILSDDLLMSQETNVELIQTEIRQLSQKDKGNYSKLKKKLEKLESVISSQGIQNEGLKQSLINAYTETADDNEEKLAFFKDQISSEIEENNLILSEELQQTEKKFNEQLTTETREIKKRIQQVNLLVTEANDSSADAIESAELEKHFSALTKLIREREGQTNAILTTIQEHSIHLEKRIDEVNKRSAKLDHIEESVSKVVFDYQKESQKVSKIVENLLLSTDGELKMTNLLDAIKENKTEWSSLYTGIEQNHEELNKKITQLEQNIHEIQKNMSQIGTSVSRYNDEHNKTVTVIDKLLKEQKADMKALLLNDQSNTNNKPHIEKIDIQAPVEETKKPERKIEATKREEPEKKQVQHNEPQKIEAKVEVQKQEEPKKVKPNAELPKNTEQKTVDTAPEGNVAESQKLAKTEPVKKEEIKVSVIAPETKSAVEKVVAQSQSNSTEKNEKSAEKPGQPSALKTAVMKEINNAEKKRLSVNRNQVNPLIDHYDKATDLFAESYTLQGANKMLKKNKSDYREAIMNANYIEYRWTSIQPDSYLFEKYKLNDFLKEVQQLPEFLSQLNAESKKESRFNQNVIKIKNSVWQKLSGYLWLSIYLEKILALETPHE
ncbi:hypothetical protein LI951_01140 [Enterococcus sp. BWT-B8]|uniref:hypothetical protein n=1 Tax=Enterococcus sp. BWT-B8 TaxID=2885157 RepID=UPI001E35D54E|nr:hypothetical protein [Enterococcus sp. BWT-B8]MCB5950665.1 hypothetical protein [Enterococcus sp. BWT-B8]